MPIFGHSKFLPVFLYQKGFNKFGMCIFGHSEFIPVFLGVHALMTGSATVNLCWAYSGFNSTSLLFGTGCVDGSGSLSGGAFKS